MGVNKLASYFNRIEDLKVHCYLCPHNCIIKPGGYGACRARKNIDGDLYSMNYARVASLALDRIEKKPLYRFHPGSMILSAGTFGCNLKCSFCQNWSIAHEDCETRYISPEALVGKAKELVRSGNLGIAYTYNEPSIWFEYVIETAKLVKEKGLFNVMVTNGFISKEPLKDLIPYIDAMNIDVKGYTSDFYNKICKGTLEDVKRTVEYSFGKCHIELTTLVIPELNDAMEQINDMSEWVAKISPDIPLHLSRFFPNYKMQDRPMTPLDTLIRAKETAEKHLKFVYLGNVF